MFALLLTSVPINPHTKGKIISKNTACAVVSCLHDNQFKCMASHKLYTGTAAFCKSKCQKANEREQDKKI